MKRVWLSLALLAAAVLALAASGGATTSEATSASGAAGAGKDGTPAGHVKLLPKFVQKKEQERLAAADLVARGKATADAEGVVTLKNGKRVQYRQEGEEYLTVALVDFSDLTHGNIPKPDRTTDNSTYWPGDVSPQHYRDMLFSDGGASYGFPSMRDFYKELSSGRFTWTGQVSNWVTLAGTAADYGANSRTGGAGSDNLNGPVGRIVQATLEAIAKNGYAGIDLGKADQADRYDCDGDGVLAEPDGYIDHFGIAHAGEGEDAGGGSIGGDAIWSHRSYANFNQESGPAQCKLGGYQLPGTDLWAADYTVEAENGGVGVFAHEFGHDLGLPDLYDRVSGDNGTGFWSLMSSGSWGSYPEADHIGTAPTHMGAWEKLALGWLGDDLAVATAGQDASFELGPSESATRGRDQALRINLPDYKKTTNAFPVDGTDPNYFYSTKDDNLDVSATKALPSPVGAGGTPISFRTIYDIETDWDYAYLRALVGGTWQNVATSVSTTTSPNGQNLGQGITGSSGGWITVTATLPAGTTAYGFRYWTDGAAQGAGFAVDTIAVGGTVDNATSTTGWTLNGFRQVTNGQFEDTYFHYYLVESHSYYLGDRSLCGSYNFLGGNLLEKQCYADGLLINYRNSGYPDNDTSVHPGHGLVLPIDAHPAPGIRPDGRTLLNARWQTWDSTFGLQPHSVTLSQFVSKGRTLKQTYTAPPVSSFYDDPSTTAYWNAAVPQNSVKTAGSGLRVDITGVSADRTAYSVHLH
jgi:immune inhibitor A